MTNTISVPRELLLELRDSANDCYNNEVRRYKDDRRRIIYKALVDKADAILAQPAQDADSVAMQTSAKTEGEQVMNEREEFEARFPIPEGAYWGECVQQYCAGELADSFACNYWMLWECWQAARAKPVVPEGYVLVPVEPTPKMIDATWYHDIDMNGGIESEGARNKRIYEAMLAAAPKE